MIKGTFFNSAAYSLTVLFLLVNNFPIKAFVSSRSTGQGSRCRADCIRSFKDLVPLNDPTHAAKLFPPIHLSNKPDILVEKLLIAAMDDENKLEEIKRQNITKSYIVLAVLLVTFASNQWCRQALYFLCDFSPAADPFKHVNAGLDFNKEMYASLASFGFTFVFAVFSLFAGGFSDRFNRNNLITVSCVLWSVATALQYGAKSYADLVPLRAMIGACQAFFNPAAYTLLADIFPKEMVGRVNGIFSGGVYLGGALASLSILLDGALGWRTTLFLIGSVGILAAVICYFLIPEPKVKESFLDAIKEFLPSQLSNRGESTSIDASTSSSSSAVATASSVAATAVTSAPNNSVSALQPNKVAASSLLQSFQEVLATEDAKLLFSAAAIRFCAGFSIAIWKAPFVFAKFPDNISSFAGSNALIVSVGGLLSSVIGGYVSDSLARPVDKSQRPVAGVWVPAVGSLLAAPFWAAFVLADTPSVAAACLFGEYLVAECWFGPTLAALFSVVPKERRGSAQGLFSMLTAAGNIAPVLVGSLAGGGLGQYSLGNVLLGVVGGCYVVSAALFTAAALREDQRIQATWEDRNSGFESSSLLLEEDEQEEQKGKVEQQRVKE